MCFVWIWEQTAIISLYSINWLVFITQTESVYCAVRTRSLYIIQVMCFVWIWEQTAIISLYSINWLVFVTETESVYCAVRTRSLYIIQVMCFVWISEQTAIISLHSINWLVFITETGSVYCVVRTGSLYTFQDTFHILFQFNAANRQTAFRRIQSTGSSKLIPTCTVRMHRLLRQRTQRFVHTCTVTMWLQWIYHCVIM